MHIETLRIRNFRRLRDVRIDLANDISIFVGANNSGKTSAAQAVQFLTGGSRERVSIHDFSASTWAAIDAVGAGDGDGSGLPSMSLDIWFHVEAADLHRAMPLIPRLSWSGSLLGLRVEFAAVAPDELLSNFASARTRGTTGTRRSESKLPATLREYLASHLKQEYGFRYFVLDRAQFDDDLQQHPDYDPAPLETTRSGSGREILKSLLRVDFMQAQRHLSDSSTGARTGDLSQCLSRFYERNLDKRDHDEDAMQALTNSEEMLNDHLQRVFEPTLSRLRTLGYPGLANPRLLIKSTLSPVSIMNSHEGAKVHYALGEPSEGSQTSTLPDRYGGLGFKNLIYMVVELLDLHAQWLDDALERPPVHLIFIEEPEAHMHAQLQQVFVRRVLDLLELGEEDREHYQSQVVVTTHSPHILYERGFRPVRYFRRREASVSQFSEVLNLSEFYSSTPATTRDFLERYLKLAHCDLFFADAAVLVEGNVERLLLGQMIEKCAPRLLSAYLSVLEIGGAFADRFRPLIEFLGLTTLVITDLDSVVAGDGGRRRTCLTSVEGAVTSNQMLIKWLPKLESITDLLSATPALKTQQPKGEDLAHVRVTYQSVVAVSWKGDSAALAGRTLEEAFALENLPWVQDNDRSELGLQIDSREDDSAQQLAENLHSRIKRSSFKKTDFALALLSEDPTGWEVPAYISEGLQWLESVVAPESGSTAQESDSEAAPTDDAEKADAPDMPDGSAE